jgi:hypothetical protein
MEINGKIGLMLWKFTIQTGVKNIHSIIWGHATIFSSDAYKLFM